MARGELRHGRGFHQQLQQAASVPGNSSSCVEVGRWRRARRAHLIPLPQAELSTWDLTSRTQGLPGLEESCDPSAGSASSMGLRTGCRMPELRFRLLSPRHNRGWRGGGCVISRRPPLPLPCCTGIRHTSGLSSPAEPQGGGKLESSQPGDSPWHASSIDIIYFLGLPERLFVCVGLSQQQPWQFGTQYGSC